MTATLTQPTVLDLIDQYCDVLRTNFQSYAIESHRRSIEKGENIEYHRKQIDQLCEGEDLYEFTYEMGKKYAKIIMKACGGQRSSHAFVDLKTGDVYKSASWKSPAKGIRYNLMDDKSREEMYRRADWAGGYLYM
jgi:hypothetical protein